MLGVVEESIHVAGLYVEFCDILTVEARRSGIKMLTFNLCSVIPLVFFSLFLFEIPKLVD